MIYCKNEVDLIVIFNKLIKKVVTKTRGLDYQQTAFILLSKKLGQTRSILKTLPQKVVSHL